ncbi:MAG TPA: alpha/beta hydrolase [Lacipirellulaceae bacterium]|jgi:acetyl esterase/lipase|nr:alpha/beta hydrolase [Lacipirellulaceae bacterium]
MMNKSMLNGLCAIGFNFRLAGGAIVIGAVAIFSPMGARAAEPVTIKLWEKGAPGTPATKPEDEPVLFVSTPSAEAPPTGTGIIVIPGGGYGGLAMDHEGKQIAEWLNSFGVTAFVLKYRMHGTGHMHPIPMMDGQRAVRLVRTRAKEWNVDPARIGVMGFSAGGHLASTLGTHLDDGAKDATDSIDHASSRPDFLILCYPVISMTGDYAHKGSVANLLGPSPDPKLLHDLSNDTQVTAQTPPTFIFQTSEDKGVPAENCVSFYLALHKAGVPVEMHIFQTGRHGLGLAKDTPGTNKWPELCREWLKTRGLLEPAKKSS